MSNTVRIKNRKKKKEVRVNYRLWAIVFGVFVAVIVGIAVWASFHWGVGMGTIGAPQENADFAATEDASEFATDDAIALTPEELEQLGISLDGIEQEADEAAEEAEAEGAAAEDAAEGEAAESSAAEGEASEGSEAEVSGQEDAQEEAGEAEGAQKE